jgi:polyhydroxyalkanoate synthesis regulator phasin
MGMWLYDDIQEMKDFQALRHDIKRLEKEYLDLRIQLRDAEAGLRSDSDDEYLKAKVKYLNKRIKDLERKGPRLAADHPLEIALFAPPHG